MKITHWLAVAATALSAATSTTGSANAALGGYLAKRTPRSGTLRWVSQQGIEMGRPSRLEIEVDKKSDAITAVRVAGSAVLMMEGRLRVR